MFAVNVVKKFLTKPGLFEEKKRGRSQHDRT
jgi:hypothetical protein